MRMFPGTKNRNAGTFAKTALLRKPPFCFLSILGTLEWLGRLRGRRPRMLEFLGFWRAMWLHMQDFQQFINHICVWRVSTTTSRSYESLPEHLGLFVHAGNFGVMLLCLLSRKNSEFFFFGFAWGFQHLALKNGGFFWWIFSGLRVLRNKARKILEKFGETSEDNSGESSVGVLRGNTIRGNTTRNSESKKALWEGLWKTSETLSNPLKTSKNLWKPLKPSLSEILSDALSEPDFPLRTSQSCCP